VLHILNAAATALQATGGKIIAEDTTANGKVRWYIGEDTGHYVIPFATAALEDVIVEMQILTAGTGANGSFDFATYGTGNDNTPLPNDLSDDAKRMLDNSPLNITDRYWTFSANNYSVNPKAKLSLEYTDAEINGSNTIMEDSLTLSYWDNNCWTSYDGTIDAPNNKFTIDTTNVFTTVALHAQNIDRSCNGSSCANAYLIDSLSIDAEFPFIVSESVFWLKYNKENCIFDFYIYGNDTAKFKISRAEVYSDCNYEYTDTLKKNTDLLFSNKQMVIDNGWVYVKLELTDQTHLFFGDYKTDIAPPVSPSPQAVESDTPYTFTFSGITTSY
jgi:hypothetical protein